MWGIPPPTTYLVTGSVRSEVFGVSNKGNTQERATGGENWVVFFLHHGIKGHIFVPLPSSLAMLKDNAWLSL